MTYLITVENESDSLRKELTDVRRQLSNCTAERDKYNSACRELRDHVKRSEHERREAARARDEAYHKIAGEGCKPSGKKNWIAMSKAFSKSA